MTQNQMADKSKTRMNLAAIKKVDPYAKDIVDTSSHVAFYIFDSDQNEWEKTDVEGAFFIYSRNAQPFHSIFINNRLNTTSFVEPITTHLELQAQAPFLLYRNERSRIRGFWFYNSMECERISKLVSELVANSANTAPVDVASTTSENGGSQAPTELKENNGVNIFKMLSNAQQEFNSSQNQRKQIFSMSNNVSQGKQNQLIASGNVMKFFEAAKPTAEVAYTQRILPNTLSVEQLEKQQRDVQPLTQHPLATELVEEATPQTYSHPEDNVTNRISCTMLESSSNAFPGQPVQRPTSASTINVKPPVLNRGPDFGFTQALTAASCPSSNLPGEQISLSKIFSNLNIQKSFPQSTEVSLKPALMPPTMFDKPASVTAPLAQGQPMPTKQEPLNKFQFIQAFTFMLQNDEDFVEKLHEAYLKGLNKFGTYQ